jgi:selenocysteine lyase/cysteine desulfurase
MTPSGNERSVDDGVVRISLVHYNTVAEVQKIIEALQDIIQE